MSLGGCLAGKSVQGFPDKSTPTLPYNPETRITKPVKTALAAITFSLSLLAGVTCAQAVQVTLYDGNSGVTPNQAGAAPNGPWLAFGTLGGSQSVVPGGTNLNTIGDRNFTAGYSNRSPGFTPGALVNPAFPNLDRNAGYTLNFTVQIVSEVSDGPNGANRAGFSVIANSSDVAAGTAASIELGFKNDRVFAQNVGFTAGEQTTGFNPVGANAINYSLSVSGNNYQLFANGNSILSGALRDYTSFAGTPNPYTTSNFIFLGDNTTQSRANINLNAVSVNTNTAAAVPFDFNPTFGLLILGAWTGFRHLKTKQK